MYEERAASGSRASEKESEIIMVSVQKGNYTAHEIGLDIGKDHTTVSRYLLEMEVDEKWGIKRDVNGSIVTSLQQQLSKKYANLQNEKFSQLPSIQKWITYLSGDITARHRWQSQSMLDSTHLSSTLQ